MSTIMRNDVEEIPQNVLLMAEYAYNSVPLYMELRDELKEEGCDFHNLPIVGKDTYMQSKTPYLSTYYVRDCIDGKLEVGKTSGSTGKVSTYYWHPDEDKMSLMELWLYRKKYYNILPTDNMVLFFPIVVEDELVNRTPHVLALSKEYLYNGKLEEAYEKIMDFQPKWMILQPSVFWMLYQLIQKKKLPIIDSVEYIEFTGEYLEDSIRKLAGDFFGCKIANQYGMREVNSMAYECPAGNMHVMQNNVYIEILNARDGIGDICITSLQNKAMPYIRYVTGDKGRLLNKKCSCGNCSPVLEVFRGRDNDWICMLDGTKLHPYSLLQIINEVNYRTNYSILQYQLVQEKIDSFTFRLVITKTADQKEIEKLICGLTAKHLQENFQIRFQYFDQIIPDIKTGKIAAFISKCRENE